MSACAALRYAAPTSAAAAAAASRRRNSSGCSTSSSSSSTTTTTATTLKTSPFRISSSSRQRRLLVVSQAKKAEKGGFGKGDSSKQKAPVKLSKRGTVASRGGQMSKKDLEQQQEVFSAIEQGKEPPTGALPPSLRAPGTEASLPPSTSSTSTTLGQQTSRPPNFSSSRAPEMREVSPVVNSRMFRRILAFSGVPIVAGIALFPAFYYLKKVIGVDVPTWVVYFVQSITWGGGLAGISYGILSSSWDPNREGTLLGGDEFRANLGAILERGREKR